MKLSVKNLGWEEPVCVVIDGECNHAATDVESEEFASPSASNTYRSHEDSIEVCRKCRAWRFATIDTDDAYQEFEWQGLTVLPVEWKG